MNSTPKKNQKNDFLELVRITGLLILVYVWVQLLRLRKAWRSILRRMA
ncbi:MAG: hypothetical protein AB1649_01520 [Chloroflexota bacterium]